MSLEYGASSVFELRYHLVMVTKYRTKVLEDNIFATIKDKILEISLNHGVTIELIEIDKTRRDHIHILLRAKPYTKMSSFIQGAKLSTSKLFFKEFPEMKEKLWNNTLWSKSYFLTTVGDTERSVIEDYISTQGAPNRIRDKNGRYIGSNKKY